MSPELLDAPETRLPRPLELVFSILFCLAGLFFLAGSVYARAHGTTPKAELTVVTGTASGVRIEEVNDRRGGYTQYLYFTVGGHTTEYASYQPGFGRIVDAIRAGKPITVGVSTKRETLLPRRGWVPLYTLSIGSEQVVTYETTMATSHRASSHAGDLVGGVLFCVGAWGLYSWYRDRPRRQATI